MNSRSSIREVDGGLTILARPDQSMWVNDEHLALQLRIEQIRMMKIITKIGEDGSLILCIVGRLTRDGCDAVHRAFRDARERYPKVTIDLAGVGLVDRASIEYLANVRRKGVALIHLPPYVGRWVDQISNELESRNLKDRRR